jgi:hypothetical protein
MFSFSIFGRKDGFTLLSPKSVAKWLEERPKDDALATVDAASALLRALPSELEKPDLGQLQALVMLDDALATKAAELTNQYVANVRAVGALEKRLWASVYDLTLGFIAAYDFLMRELPQRMDAKRWQAGLLPLLVRLMRHRGIDAKFRLFRYEQWIPGRWRDLHANYALACRHGLDKTSTEVAGAEGPLHTSIAREYLHTLLLQLMNTGNLAPPQVEWLNSKLAGWSTDIELTPHAKSPEGFYVDLSGVEGLRRKRFQPTGGQFLYLDTTPMHGRIVQYQQALKDELSKGPSRQVETQVSEQLSAISKVVDYFAPEFKPVTRNEPRAQEAIRARLVIGFRPSWNTLTEMDRWLERKAKGPAGQQKYSYTDKQALFIYGHISEQTGKQREQQEAKAREKAPEGPPMPVLGDPCQILDRGPTGCRVLTKGNGLTVSDLGTLAIFQEEGREDWTLGIVRRIKRITADQVDLGLQIIALRPVRIMIQAQRHRLPSGYSVDGEETTIQGQRREGFYLTPIDPDGKSASKTLIVPASEYEANQVINVNTGQTTYSILLRHALERHAEWVWTTMEVVGKTAATPPPATPAA